MSSTVKRARGRKKVAVVAAGAVALAGVGVAQSQLAGADTQTVTNDLTCSIIGVLSVSYTTTDTPDPAVAGGSVSLAVTPNLPAITTDVPVNTVTMAIPVPAGLDAASGTVAFSGGNIVGSYTVSGSNLNLTFQGNGISSTQIVVPNLTITANVLPSAAGSTITWIGPQQIQLGVDFIGTPITETCTINAGAPALNTTAVGAAPTTTTTAAPTTTTTRATTTTTAAPTTTTTRATTTTTAAPTTTTTRATTTTTRPTTTTTAAPTTTTTRATTTTRPTTTTTRATTTTTRATTTTSRATTTTTRATTTTSRATTTSRPVTTTTESEQSYWERFFKWLVCYLFGC